MADIVSYVARLSPKAVAAEDDEDRGCGGRS